MKRILFSLALFALVAAPCSAQLYPPESGSGHGPGIQQAIKVELSAAQVASAGSSPVLIIDGVSGYVIVPQVVVMHKPAGTAFDLGASSFPQLKYDTSSPIAVVSLGPANGVLDQTSDRSSLSALSSITLLANSDAGQIGGKGILFGTNGNGDYSDGSPVQVFVLYQLVPTANALLSNYPTTPLP